MNNFRKLKQLLDDLESDFSKFYEKENKAAGTRIRKTLQEIKVLSQDIRKDVQERKNSMK